jgi:hypothetical protein
MSFSVLDHQTEEVMKRPLLGLPVVEVLFSALILGAIFASIFIGLFF